MPKFDTPDQSVKVVESTLKAHEKEKAGPSIAHDWLVREVEARKEANGAANATQYSQDVNATLQQAADKGEIDKALLPKLMLTGDAAGDHQVARPAYHKPFVKDSDKKKIAVGDSGKPVEIEVKPGDNPTKIAEAYLKDNGDAYNGESKDHLAHRIVELNNITGLKPTDKIFMPKALDAEADKPVRPGAPKVAEADKDKVADTVEVKPGDNPTKIAEAYLKDHQDDYYGETKDQLATRIVALNGHYKSLWPGDSLAIPNPNEKLKEQAEIHKTIDPVVSAFAEKIKDKDIKGAKADLAAFYNQVIDDNSIKTAKDFAGNSTVQALQHELHRKGLGHYADHLPIDSKEHDPPHFQVAEAAPRRVADDPAPTPNQIKAEVATVATKFQSDQEGAGTDLRNYLITNFKSPLGAHSSNALMALQEGLRSSGIDPQLEVAGSGSETGWRVSLKEITKPDPPPVAVKIDFPKHVNLDQEVSSINIKLKTDKKGAENDLNFYLDAHFNPKTLMTHESSRDYASGLLYLQGALSDSGVTANLVPPDEKQGWQVKLEERDPKPTDAQVHAAIDPLVLKIREELGKAKTTEYDPQQNADQIFIDWSNKGAAQGEFDESNLSSYLADPYMSALLNELKAKKLGISWEQTLSDGRKINVYTYPFSVKDIE